MRKTFQTNKAPGGVAPLSALTVGGGLVFLSGLTAMDPVTGTIEGDAAAHELPALKERLGGRYAVILSGENWVDVMRPGVSKGRAMQMLQQLKGLTPQECMAFGDYLNDLELLESVSESYAMENALEELKRVAKYIAPGNDENGVMRVIRERFAL